jgi:SSS family transporter
MAKFSLLDWMVLGMYMASMAVLALYLSRRQKNVEDFCLAGRKMGWFPIALSIIATGVSAISLVGVPTYIFRHNLQMSSGQLLMKLPLMFVGAFLMIPVFYRLKVYTVNEYLEHRFHPTLRPCVSIITMLVRLGWIATAIYIPSLLLSAILDIPVWSCVLLIGGLSTLYTVFGGLEAVIWTDVIQFFTIVIGLLIMFGIMLNLFDGSMSQIWREAKAAGCTRMFNFNLSFTEEATFLAIFVGYFFAILGQFSDQVFVQRVFATKNMRNAVGSILGFGIIGLPFTLLLVLIGLGFAAFFHAYPDAMSGLLRMDPDRSIALDKAMSYFIIHKIPAGVRGLIIASLFAVTMSSVDSAINSMSTMVMKDIVEPYSKKFVLTSERFKLNFIRFLTLLFGTIATIGGMFVGQIGTIMKIFVTLAAVLGAPVVGIFLLGLFTKRANIVGIIWGSIVSYIICFICAFHWHVNWTWLAPINAIDTIIVGYVVSIVHSRFTQRPDEEPIPVDNESMELTR